MYMMLNEEAPPREPQRFIVVRYSMEKAGRPTTQLIRRLRAILEDEGLPHKVAALPDWIDRSDRSAVDDAGLVFPYDLRYSRDWSPSPGMRAYRRDNHEPVGGVVALDPDGGRCLAVTTDPTGRLTTHEPGWSVTADTAPFKLFLADGQFIVLQLIDVYVTNA